MQTDLSSYLRRSQWTGTSALTTVSEYRLCYKCLVNTQRGSVFDSSGADRRMHLGRLSRPFCMCESSDRKWVLLYLNRSLGNENIMKWKSFGFLKYVLSTFTPAMLFDILCNYSHCQVALICMNWAAAIPLMCCHNFHNNYICWSIFHYFLTHPSSATKS